MEQAWHTNSHPCQTSCGGPRGHEDKQNRGGIFSDGRHIQRLVEQFVMGIYDGTTKLHDGREEARILAAGMLQVAWNATEATLRGGEFDLDVHQLCDRVTSVEGRLDEVYDGEFGTNSASADNDMTL